MANLHKEVRTLTQALPLVQEATNLQEENKNLVELAQSWMHWALDTLDPDEIVDPSTHFENFKELRAKTLALNTEEAKKHHAQN